MCALQCSGAAIAQTNTHYIATHAHTAMCVYPAVIGFQNEHKFTVVEEAMKRSTDASES
jgi:hypothetical protein